MQVRETDIDTLERCCAAMAFGDLSAEEPGSLSETNFTRLFRLAQLTVEYLLHVQDRLVWETGLLKARCCCSIYHVIPCEPGCLLSITAASASSYFALCTRACRLYHPPHIRRPCLHVSAYCAMGPHTPCHTWLMYLTACKGSMQWQGNMG